MDFSGLSDDLFASIRKFPSKGQWCRFGGHEKANIGFGLFCLCTTYIPCLMVPTVAFALSFLKLLFVTAMPDRGTSVIYAVPEVCLMHSVPYLVDGVGR